MKHLDRTNPKCVLTTSLIKFLDFFLNSHRDPLTSQIAHHLLTAVARSRQKSIIHHIFINSFPTVVDPLIYQGLVNPQFVSIFDRTVYVLDITVISTPSPITQPIRRPDHRESIYPVVASLSCALGREFSENI